MSDELFDIVNERDEVVGRAPRREVHARGLWHRAIHVLVFNAAGQVFLQKRSMRKDTAAGLWDSSCSGHVDAGEDYDTAAVRELGEELGFKPGSPPERWIRFHARPETSWEFVWVYRLRYEGPFELNADEIESGAWFEPKALSVLVREKQNDFASSFRLIWEAVAELPAPGV